jgi:hypothetical protein
MATKKVKATEVKSPEEKPKRKKAAPAANGSTPASSDVARSHKGYSHDEVARRAYFLWEQRGRADGGAEMDWFRAEMSISE